MKYEEAFKIVTDRMSKEDPNFKGVTEETDRIASFVWNIVATALSENKLDDFALIGKDNSVVSLSLDEKGKEKRDSVNEEKKAKATKSPKQPKSNNNGGENTGE